MPCREWFDEQDQAYRETVLPPTVKARVSVEAGVAHGLARDRRRPRPDRLASSTSAPPPTTRCSTRSSASPPRPSPPPPRDSLRPVTRLSRAPARGTAPHDTAHRHSGGTHERPSEGPRRRGRLHLARRPVPRAASSPATSPTWSTTRHVVGVTTNPTIFAGGASPTGERYDDQVARARRRRRRRRRGDLRAHHRRRPQRLRHPARRSYDATDGVDGRVSIEVEPDLAHDTDGTIASGPGPVDGRRPAQRADQDPRHRGGPAGDHRGDRRGHQRQRHADLRPRALPRGHGRLPRPASSRRRDAGHDLSHDPLGRLVLRLPRRHRGRQAARRDRHRRGHGAEGQGRHRQRPAGLRGLRGGVRQRPLAAARGRRRPPRSARCGPRPASRTRPTPTPCTSPSWSSPTPSTRCPRRRWRPSPTTARSPATRSPAALRRGAGRCSTASSGVGIDFDDVVQVLEHEGVEKFEKSWTELVETVQRPDGEGRRGPA